MAPTLKMFGVVSRFLYSGGWQVCKHYSYKTKKKFTGSYTEVNACKENPVVDHMAISVILVQLYRFYIQCII